MTAYNREAFLGEAVESVLRSSLEDFELIVVDDCSTDGTAALVRSYEERDSRVRLFVNETNLGDYFNRNRAASHARGEFLKYVDSDDAIYPHGLQVMVECMSRFPHAGLGLSELPDPSGPCPRFLTPAEAYRENFFEHELFGRAPGSAIVRRAAFEQVGGFSGRRQVGDHELWLKMAARFGLVKMPTDLLWDRQHAEQEKNYDDQADKALMHEELQLAALSAAECPLSPEERRAAIERLAADRARRYLMLLRNGGGFAPAEKYRRGASLPASAITGFLWDRITKRSRGMSPDRGRTN
jgi:glycosyltransferase involved in cell wall biosynthesis